MTTIVAGMQADVKEYYTGVCEYLGDDNGNSVIASCDENSFIRSYYVGDTACSEDSFYITEELPWGECTDQGYGYWAVAETTEFSDFARSLAVAASAFSLAAMQLFWKIFKYIS